MLTKFISSLALLLFCLSAEAHVLEVQEEDVIDIDGVIFDKRLLPRFRGNDEMQELLRRNRIADMPSVARLLIKKVRAGKKHLYIRINSPGGLVSAGELFINFMKQAQKYGVKTTCIVDGIAMSMALVILTECDNRLATFGSQVMWHSVSMSGSMRINDKSLEELAEIINEINTRLWNPLRKFFDNDYFTRHFVNESHLNVLEIQEVTKHKYLKVLMDFRVKYEDDVVTIQPVDNNKTGEVK